MVTVQSRSWKPLIYRKYSRSRKRSKTDQHIWWSHYNPKTKIIHSLFMIVNTVLSFWTSVQCMLGFHILASISLRPYLFPTLFCIPDDSLSWLWLISYGSHALSLPSPLILVLFLILFEDLYSLFKICPLCFHPILFLVCVFPPLMHLLGHFKQSWLKSLFQ